MIFEVFTRPLPCKHVQLKIVVTDDFGEKSDIPCPIHFETVEEASTHGNLVIDEIIAALEVQKNKTFVPDNANFH